jgi:hypothetical protein
VKKHFKRRVFILAFFALVAVSLLTTKAFCRCRKALDTRGWYLRNFVAHLHDQGVRLRVVASHADGRWSDTIYLTIDPDATWHTLQRKNMSVERLRQWQGTVWVHRIGPVTDVEGRLLDWQGHGCRIGGFLVFGDAVLIDRIRDAIPTKAPE